MHAANGAARRYDNVPFPGRPWVTYALMLAIMLVMCAEILVSKQPGNSERMLNTFGLVSSDFRWGDADSYIPLVTFNFLHSGGRHFAGNAIIMLFACAAVERHAGRKATLFVWLIGGIVAGIAHIFIMPDAALSLVGASGAISAAIGAAFILGWHWALPVRFRRSGRTFFRIPLPAVIAVWVAFQAMSFVSEKPHLDAGPAVATWVHLAGFAFGVLAAGILCLYRLHASRGRPSPHYSLAGD